MESDENKPATKSELQSGLKAVKEEIGAEIRVLQTDMRDVKEKTQNLDKTTKKLSIEVATIRETIATKLATKEDLKVIQTDVRRMTHTVDSFVNKLDTYTRESVTIPRTLDKHGAALQNHEQRISSLESPRL